MSSSAAVFKAYDVRGLVPTEIDEPLCRLVGNAFVAVTGARTVAVGHDMRPSSPGLAQAFAEGALAAGADVVMIGLASTDQLYFASGLLGVPGAMFTASHNPAQYNGIKLCRAHAAPVGRDTGLTEIRDRVLAGEEQLAASARRAQPPRRPGRLRRTPPHAGAGARAPAARGGRRRQRHGRAHRTRRAG